jgi:hypothetical protein
VTRRRRQAEPEQLPAPAPTGEDAPVPPPLTAGERDFLRFLVRAALERRKQRAKVA